VGEAIVVMLGMTKASPLWTTVAMAVGKAARYVLIVLGLAGVATIF
jgi:membrane protein YqaA with SNARE-associated domain